MKRFNKIHRFFGALLIMMTFLWSGASLSFAGQASGVLDYINGNAAGGWAWNSSDPAAVLEVKVTVTNQATGQTTAQFISAAHFYREDLKNKGTGTGNYGFQVEIPWDTYEDGIYVVEAYANGQKLSGSLIRQKGEAGEAGSTASLVSSNMRSLGIFRTTGYCPCYQCSEGWGRNTSTGAIAAANHTIAVDPRVIPYGSRVMINGVIYTAEDRGGAVKGNHIDIFFNTHGETIAHGSRKAEVFLLP